MTFVEYLEEVKSTLKNTLESCGFINGDEVGQKDVLPTKTYFFENYNEKPDFQNKDYVCWQLLENETNRHGDNIKIGGEQFFGVVIVTPKKVNSKAIKTLASQIENKFLEDTDWNLIEMRTFTEEDTKRNFVNFTISRVFGK